MVNADGRRIHHADSHLMEFDDCHYEFFTPALLPRLHTGTGYRAALQRDLRPIRMRTPAGSSTTPARTAVTPVLGH